MVHLTSAKIANTPVTGSSLSSHTKCAILTNGHMGVNCVASGRELKVILLFTCVSILVKSLTGASIVAGVLR